MVKVCPICQRKVAGKEALKQHMVAVHPAGKPVPLAGSSGRTRRPPRRGGADNFVSAGKDVLQTITVASGTAAGTVLWHIPLGPRHCGSTRLQAESSLWSRWKPTSLKFTMVGSGSASTYGSLMFGWVADPTSKVSSVKEMAISQVGAMQSRLVMRLGATAAMSLPLVMSRRWYETDGDTQDEEEFSHGSICCVVAATTGGYAGQSLSVIVELDWKVQFEGPKLPDRVEYTPGVIMPDNGWYNLFTTSDGSFDAGRLTFKMHEGGNMVPFSSAQPDVAYCPDIGTHVYAVTEDNKVSEVNWFAKVKNYVVPGLLCFASKADCKAYIESGDVSKAMKYVAASKYTTPRVPRFKVTNLEAEVPAVTLFVPNGGSQEATQRLLDLEHAVQLLTENLRLRDQAKVTTEAMASKKT
ncbi:hypothetical protein [Erysiphe necator associated nodavirus 5]|nr:hypothetical protein [Erysiphe necator associated nodavirus 5]